MGNIKIMLVIIALLAFALIMIVLFIRRNSSKKGTKDDREFYDLDDDTAYRRGVYNQVRAEFKPYLEELYRSIDELRLKIERHRNEINQAQYESMLDILRNADMIEKKIRDYWNNQKFQRDFSFYIGLHYASHLLAGTIKEEQQKIKNTFVSCKRKQDEWGNKISSAQRQQERFTGEQRRKLSKEIGDMCKIHKSISALKGQIGAVNSRYNERVTQQNIETGKRRDYIANNFGDRGQRWKERCKQRAYLRKS